MTNFDWAPPELQALLQYKDGKLMISCSSDECSALRSTAGKGVILKKIERGLENSLLFCREHGGKHGKFSQEVVGSWPEGHKQCNLCREIKPFDEFHKHSSALFGYAVECKVCRMPASKKNYANTTFQQTMFSSSKARAKKKGLAHTITIDDIIIPKYCPVLKHDIVLERNHLYRPSLDRIDSKRGYTKDNIIVMSWRANWIKNNMDFSEMLALAVWDYEYNVGQSFHYCNGGAECRCITSSK